MTTYIDGKAVGVGTIRAEIGVTGVVLHDSTLKGNGNTEPLGVDTEVIATTNQVGNLATTLNTAIDAQAEAIQKTREDYIQADSEIHQILNNHAENLTTLHNDVDDLGDQVAEIESKIPESASENNPLITKQQLLDEEMDIRSDLIDIQGELQTQITAQATEIVGKLNKTEAGIAGGIATLDSNAKVPMSQINDSLLGNVQYQGLYNASTNTPNLDTVATKGHYYIVSVAGERFGIKFEVGDWIISDGTNWTKVDNTDAVSSVNGRTGNVIITKEDFDLSEYVKNTDYPTSTNAGVIKTSLTNGVSVTSGQLAAYSATLDQYKNARANNCFIAKGTLENIKDDYVKRGLTENAIQLTDEEKITACNWLGTNKTESLTQTEYDALATKDTNILYLIEEE